MPVPNVLPDAFIVALTYALVQLIKPLILSVLPQDNPIQNNVTRAVGYALTYGLLLGNHAVQGTVLWPDLWGLLPVAGALYASSALLYHITDNGQADVSAIRPTETVAESPPASVPVVSASQIERPPQPPEPPPPTPRVTQDHADV